MRKRRKKASFLILIWVMMFVHCLADKAFAHWHFEEDIPYHHHHIYLENDHIHNDHSHSDHSESHHEHTGDQHSIADCCKFISLVRVLKVDIAPELYISAPVEYSPQPNTEYVLLTYITSPTDPPLTNRISKFLTDVLISSNAPPLRLLS